MLLAMLSFSFCSFPAAETQWPDFCTAAGRTRGSNRIVKSAIAHTSEPGHSKADRTVLSSRRSSGPICLFVCNGEGALEDHVSDCRKLMAAREVEGLEERSKDVYIIIAGRGWE